MVWRVCIFLCFAIFGGYSVSSDKSTCAGKGTTMDGWDFLQIGSQIDMVKRTFNTSANTSCMSSTTMDKNNDTHTAWQMVRYYDWNNKSWVNGTQNLTAYRNEQGKYNFMNTTYTLGPANTSYRFLYVEHNCTVVQVAYLNKSASSRSSVSTQTETRYTSCAMWVRDADLETNHTCCEHFFNTNCTGLAYDVYDTKQCKSIHSNTVSS